VALTAELGKINDAEQDVRDFHRDEVYVGFTELDTLLEPLPSEVSAVEEPVGGVAVSAMSTQTELVDLSALDAAATSSWRASIRGKPEDQRSLTALLQGALDHIVELDLRLASERDRNETLRADVIRERGRADARVAEAEEREAEAVRRAARTDRKLEEAERQLSERECEVEDAKAASDMEHIGEKNELRARIRGLTHELALVVKGTS
jgi:chromosome segregation ATPase